MAEDDSELRWREVDDLARDLMLAQEPDTGRGRAVFLVGAGCSASANIPVASGVAKRCAIRLANVYSRGALAGIDPEEHALDALTWLSNQGHVPADLAFSHPGGDPRWGTLYTHFFGEHLKAPNQQRSVISDIVAESGGRLNWAHACLGELVRQRYAHSVLTTNFDQLVLTALFRAGIIPVVADGMFALNRIVGRPLVPQVVHLHGSMHTYNLRNSYRSMQETKDDSRAVTMMNAVLQQCDVLVVVGYAGGEEGVMDLLLQAARHHEQLVVYWVAFERDPGKLSSKCRELLAGENKFAIDGGEADAFFGELMARLEIGQPNWVGDPLGELARQADLLVTPKGNSEVAILIDAFRGRVRAAASLPAPRVGAQHRLEAARLRAEGDFAKARAALEELDLHDDPEAARLHALNALSLFEAEPGPERRRYLDAAVSEFRGLADTTGGEARLENVISLIDAHLDLYELTGESEHLETIVRIATGALEATPVEPDGRLLSYRALAHHRLAEAAGNDIGELQAAEQDYRAALAARTTISRLELQEGLAAAVQVLGLKLGDVLKLRDSVRLFRSVVENTRRNVTSPEEGGVLYNLSGALIDLMRMVDPEERVQLSEEAERLLERAELSFRLSGSSDRLTEVRALRDDLRVGRLPNATDDGTVASDNPARSTPKQTVES